MALEQLQLLEQQIGQPDQELATLLHPHHDAVQRLAKVPGLGVESAQQIIAEVGPTRSYLSVGGTTLLMGGRLRRRRRKRRPKLQPPISEGQPSHAALTQSGG
jgi:hypothetical protein